MTYGGYEGFEKENIRQATLRGRHFTPGDKTSRVRHYHDTNVPVGPKVGVTDSLPALPVPGSRGGRRHVVAGEVTKYGSANKRFNVITGEPDSKSYSVCPLFNTYANRIPVHMLPKEAQEVVMQGPDVDMRPSEPRRAGVDGNMFMRQYTCADQALKPLGAQPLHDPKPEAAEYTSLNLWRADRTKHWRTQAGPHDRAPFPQTSGQEYGWTAYSRERAMAASLRPSTMSSSLSGGSTWRGRNCCRETRFAQSILLGARHKSGYGGQGCL